MTSVLAGSIKTIFHYGDYIDRFPEAECEDSEFQPQTAINDAKSIALLEHDICKEVPKNFCIRFVLGK